MSLWKHYHHVSLWRHYGRDRAKAEGLHIGIDKSRVQTAEDMSTKYPSANCKLQRARAVSDYAQLELDSSSYLGRPTSLSGHLCNTTLDLLQVHVQSTGKETNRKIDHRHFLANEADRE